VAESCEHGDEPSGSGATELVSSLKRGNEVYEIIILSVNISPTITFEPINRFY
jgi:hypothetical protein